MFEKGKKVKTSFKYFCCFQFSYNVNMLVVDTDTETVSNIMLSSCFTFSSFRCKLISVPHNIFIVKVKVGDLVL